MARDFCTRCGDRIVWAETFSRKKMPLNPSDMVVSDDFTVDKGGGRAIVVRDGIAVVLHKGMKVFRNELIFISHFATCGDGPVDPAKMAKVGQMDMFGEFGHLVADPERRSRR